MLPYPLHRKNVLKKLIDELKITDAKAYGNYEDVIKDPNVHVVYIALHNEAHNPWCKRAIEAGKPVLCEKPLAVNTREVKEVIELAQKKKVLLVEAFWSRWFPAFQHIKKIVQSGELGEPKVVHSVFGYPHEDNWRCAERGESPLTLFALYTIMITQWVYGQKAEKISVIGEKDKHDVDDWATIVLDYGNNRRGICYYDSRTFLPQTGFVAFERGQIQLPEYFWCPEKLKQINGPMWFDNKDRKDLEFPLNDDRFYNYNHSSGLRYEQDHIFDLIKEGKTESDVMSHTDSLQVIEMLDEVRRQLKVVFPHDQRK
ncbi:Trans-1,2-dihydrobenzene-1,2-diol dehydrogenase isoform X1 [Aphelenchoides besseyi]|nr:Trans-1,2-dihydrobenzene-1,2-diol dehydrogenase isoform X1 [Aphelenchoides besseyi]